MTVPSGAGIRVVSLLFALACAAAPATAAPRYHFVPMGSINGNPTSSWAWSINHQGVVAGTALVAGISLAVRWDPATGHIAVIPAPGFSRGEWAEAINDSGQVVGHWMPRAASGGALFWDGAASTEIGGLPPYTVSSYAQDISNGGEVVGYSGYSTGTQGGVQAWRWKTADGGLPEPLGFLPGDDHSAAFAVNEQGQIAGQSWSGGGIRAFFWDPVDGFTPLDDGAVDSFGHDINEQGQVAGYLTDAENSGRAFLWTPGQGTQRLATYAGDRYSARAEGLNNAGLVVGWTEKPDIDATRAGAFAWRAATGMVSLAEDVDAGAAGWDLLVAQDVNDHGTIAGYGKDPDGMIRAFVLIDTLEPASDLLKNGSFEEEGQPAAVWSGKNLGRRDRRLCGTAYDGSCLALLAGSPARKSLEQEIALPAGTVFRLGGWSRATALDPGGGFAGLRARAFFGDGTTALCRVGFPKRTHGWLHRSTVCDFGRPADRIVVSVALERQSGKALFDKVFLTEGAGP